MDALSQLVTLLDPRGRMALRCLFGTTFTTPHAATGPWRAPFHVVLRGGCELWLPDEQRSLSLRPGTLLVLPRGSAHTLRARDPARPASAGARVRSQAGALVELKTNVRDAALAEIEILCGEFEFRGRRRSALLEALPASLVVEFAERPEFGWLQGLLRMMAHEVAQQGPGAAAIIGELAGALFTLAVRAHLETAPAPAGLLGVMASARLAPALAAMLDAPDRPWTVASLAERCHLSRAAFARLFAHHAGSAPLELLTTLRMELAARLLATSEADTGSVGEAVGYRSAAAFNRAFARHAGVTPARFRRAARA